MDVEKGKKQAEEEMEKMKKEIQELNEENIKLRATVDEISSTVEELSQENGNLKSQVEYLSNKVQSLEEENMNFHIKVEDLTKCLVNFELFKPNHEEWQQQHKAIKLYQPAQPSVEEDVATNVLHVIESKPEILQIIESKIVEKQPEATQSREIDTKEAPVVEKQKVLLDLCPPPQASAQNSGIVEFSTKTTPSVPAFSAAVNMVVPKVSTSPTTAPCHVSANVKVTVQYSVKVQTFELKNLPSFDVLMGKFNTKDWETQKFELKIDDIVDGTYSAAEMAIPWSRLKSGNFHQDVKVKLSKK